MPPISAAEAAERLAAITERIAAACRRSGRDPASVALLAASKTQPAPVLVPYLQAGLRLLGENRVQEAQAKQRELAGLAAAGEARALPPPGLEWHLIGPLQSNKVRLALDLFRCIHSIDRPEIAAVVDREAARRGAGLTGLLEINLGGEPSKHGFAVAGLDDAVRPLASLTHLRIVGLMAIPPPAESAAAAHSWFRRLRELRDHLGSLPEWRGWPGLLSMGMSDDFEAAVEEGATHVRLGTALFGPRGAATPPLSMLI
jgi:pyridoxal phosphate enzyme (YggS family)